ncbi:MAG: hypothetical protein U0270_23295 [Labilithrix sp.]
MKSYAVAILVAAPALALACSSSSEVGVSSPDAGALAPGASPPGSEDGDLGDGPNASPTNLIPIVKLPDGGTQEIDPDAGVEIEVPPYATKVVSFAPGKCAGFGNAKLPNVVLGPPVGGGEEKGSTDVVSLGTGGEIVLSFEPNVLVDGPGVDLLVFENAFYANGADKPFAEIAEVSVSEDGVTWHTFPCTATEYPWGACAGWHTVSKEDSSSLDPEKVGGDPFDLHDIGVTRAKFVRIVDKGGMACNPVNNPKTNGFDLDAIAALHVSK